MSEIQLKEVKLHMIENILATDMKLHFPMLADFKKKLTDSLDICKILLTKDTAPDILEATKLFTHCADLSGSCKEFAIASRWSHFVNRDFNEQVDSSYEVSR